MNFKMATTDELRKELEKRGFQTKNLWHIADVDRMLETINRDSNKSTKLNENEKMEVLISALHSDGVMATIYESIKLFLQEKWMSRFILTELADDIANGEFNYSAFAYTIDHDVHNKEWELDIISTSLSELEGSEEGILFSYRYNSQEELLADVEALRENTYASFDEI